MAPTNPRSNGQARSSTQSSKKRTRDAVDEFTDVRRAGQAMDTTFITIHDLTYDANILYASTSVTDVLDWKAEDVVGRSCWDFFHPDEVPFAKAIHGRGIELDKASVLNYCRIMSKNGDWVGCECVFTVVYNVLIGCTSVYMDGPKAKKRAVEAPVVRQLFSSSPRDPRYHMLQYISSKFASGPRPHLHEPRAALFLNRFTRTLSINFATNGLESLLGIPASELTGQSFYYCIQENCLGEAIRCLESAKANDSIAYLRFWFRDPRSDGISQHSEIIDEADGSSDDDDDDGGVQLAPQVQGEGTAAARAVQGASSTPPAARGRSSEQHLASGPLAEDSRDSSGNSTDMGKNASEAMFDESSDKQPSTPRSMMSLDSPEQRTSPRAASRDQTPTAPRQIQSQASTPIRRDVELEAVVSCTSDGLVVIMRAARPFVPDSVRVPPQRAAVSPYSNGLFASPWALNPVMPDPSRFPSFIPANSFSSGATPHVPAMGSHPAFVQGPTADTPTKPVTRGDTGAIGTGPPLIDFMASIRDVAVFAWGLTGINGSLQQYGRGKPMVGALPSSGLPVWDPDGSLSSKEKELGLNMVRDVADGAVVESFPPNQQPASVGHNGKVDATQNRMGSDSGPPVEATRPEADINTIKVLPGHSDATAQQPGQMQFVNAKAPTATDNKVPQIQERRMDGIDGEAR